MAAAKPFIIVAINNKFGDLRLRQRLHANGRKCDGHHRGEESSSDDTQVPAKETIEKRYKTANRSLAFSRFQTVKPCDAREHEIYSHSVLNGLSAFESTNERSRYRTSAAAVKPRIRNNFHS